MLGMMGSRFGQQMSGNASGFGAYDTSNPFSGVSAAGPAGGSMAMSGGGMDPMGSISNINKQTVQSQMNQSGGMGDGSVKFSNPIGGMLGSIFGRF